MLRADWVAQALTKACKLSDVELKDAHLEAYVPRALMMTISMRRSRSRGRTVTWLVAPPNPSHSCLAQILFFYIRFDLEGDLLQWQREERSEKNLCRWEETTFWALMYSYLFESCAATTTWCVWIWDAEQAPVFSNHKLVCRYFHVLLQWQQTQVEDPPSPHKESR